MKTARFHDAILVAVKKLRISRGLQITVPAESRRVHGLKPGDEVIWVDTGHQIFLRCGSRFRKLTDLIGRYTTEHPFDAVAEHDEATTTAPWARAR